MPPPTLPEVTLLDHRAPRIVDGWCVVHGVVRVRELDIGKPCPLCLTCAPPTPRQVPLEARRCPSKANHGGHGLHVVDEGADWCKYCGACDREIPAPRSVARPVMHTASGPIYSTDEVTLGDWARLATAVVDALPRCFECGALATRFEHDDALHVCDKCGPDCEDLRYAGALRAFLRAVK